MNLRWRTAPVHGRTALVHGDGVWRVIGVRWCSLVSLMLALQVPACSADAGDEGTPVDGAGGSGATDAELGDEGAVAAGDNPEPTVVTTGTGTVTTATGTPTDGIILEEPGGVLIVDAGLSPSCELADDASPSRELASYAASNDDVGRRIIYSWTTAEQIDELRGDPTLLTRVMSENGERGRAADYILNRAETGGFFEILARPDYEAKRFGWSNPWATLLGWAGETYGDQLLEIQLRPEAWVGRLVTTTGEWSFFDVDNNPVDPALVSASPERIGAFLFVDDQEVFGCGGSFGSGPALREYVLCNEAMIEGWSAFTPHILAELERAKDVLGQFRDSLAAADCQSFDDSLDCWRGRVVELWRVPVTTTLESYETALAIPNELYTPTTANMDRLIERLDTVSFEPNPLEFAADDLADETVGDSPNDTSAGAAEVTTETP